MLPHLRFAGFSVGTYGLLVAAGYLAGTLWLWTRREHLRLSERAFWALVYTIFFSALIGARLGYYVVEWEYIRRHPTFLWTDWAAGWVFWPGLFATMLGGLAYQFFYNRAHRPRAYLPVADYFTPCLALGHVFGRLGCFAEGCCYGRPTDLPWGAVFTHPACSVRESLMGVPLHPVQLYEAAGSLAIFVFLGYWVLPRIRAGKLVYGASFFGYILLYSVMRFVLESFRGDDRGVLLHPALSPSQWLSLAGAAIAVFAFSRLGVLERAPGKRSLYLSRARKA